MPRRHRRNSIDPEHAHKLTFSCYEPMRHSVVSVVPLWLMIDYHDGTTVTTGENTKSCYSMIA